MLMPGRKFNAGNYNFGFNGKWDDDIVKGTGNLQDYGMRMYDPRLGRFLSVDPLIIKYPNFSPYHSFANNPILFVDPNGMESIIIAGGVDIGHEEADQYKFINSAFGHARRHSTIILMTANMTKEQIVKVLKFLVVFNWNTGFDVNLVLANSADEAINYINSKSTAQSCPDIARQEDLVTDVTVYSHGVVGNIEVGYPHDTPEDNKYDITKEKAEQFEPAAFCDGAEIDLYACNTATTSDDNINMAQVISKTTGVIVTGYEGRTDYANIYGNLDYLIKRVSGLDLYPACNEPDAGHIKGTDNASILHEYKAGEEIK